MGGPLGGLFTILKLVGKVLVEEVVDVEELNLVKT